MSRNKAIVLSVVFLLAFSFIHAQKKKATINKLPEVSIPKKYKSLLWEITGNGLTRPSYLFGTMHVSNKLVFNLSDSFYRAIRNVDVVALEQNPEVWQEEFSKPGSDDINDGMSLSRFMDNYHIANDRMTIQTFSVGNYESKIKLALASEARMINGMLYRNNVGMEDFEEETYLDMYIYRLGRKLNKIVTGVEDYKESNRIVKEAYLAMYKDKNRKANRSYDRYGDKNKMEDAYKRGDLDMLDSLQMLSVVSDAFQEKFMYRRNEIQCNSIDTIIRHHSLFVGVGAAHLPGARGVIELLRKKGYQLRPVFMGQRDSDEKERVEKIRVPVVFNRQYSEDSLFSVEIPGKKFFRYRSFGQQNMVQYADMSNGSYYMVTRVKTDAAILGQTPSTVLKKIDSLLYENVPGKMLSKKAITKNGYDGFDITNRTRKGDIQRYNIFVLPNEVLIFKISGLNDYINEGKEAGDFFASVNIKNASQGNESVLYQPPYGGFQAAFPAQPLYIAEERNDKSRSEWISADDKGNTYFIFKANIQQYEYIEEDTFELRLMEQSFRNSKIFNHTPTDGKTGSWNKYPIIDARYKHTDDDEIKVRYLLQGNNYFVIGAKVKKGSADADKFINSFNITSYNYNAASQRKDTAIGFTVKSPLFYKTEIDSSDNFSMRDLLNASDDDDKSSYAEILSSFAMKTIGNDTTGEHINLTVVKLPKYTYVKDSADFRNKLNFIEKNDSTYIVRWKQTYKTPKGWLCNYEQYCDTGSSRVFTAKSFYKQGILFHLVTQGDTITQPSAFIKDFFETFEPSDTFKIVNPFEKKSALFFADYFSSDSTVRKGAARSISASIFDSSDLPQVKKAIGQLSWKNKNYLDLKKTWINVVGSFTDTASLHFLTTLYAQVKDTSDLQNAVLDALLDMKTTASFTAFKDLIVTEPPALTSDNNNPGFRYNVQIFSDAFTGNIKPKKRTNLYGSKWEQLYDTLSLASKIIPGMLDLMILDDYKPDVVKLLENAVDSGYIKADDYKQNFNRFLLEAKQSLKKEIAEQEKKEMNKLDKDGITSAYDRPSFNYQASTDNDLISYAKLLLPFWERSPEVPAFFEKVLRLKDKSTRTAAAILMLRNKKAVSDSLVNTIAADDNYRIKLYNSLKQSKMLDKFPVKYKNQHEIARSGLRTRSYYRGYDEDDTLVYIDRLQVNEPKQKGWIYFFRYKKSKEDTDWKIASSGLQPLDTLKLATNEDDLDDALSFMDNDFTEYTDEVYPESGHVKPVLQKILKKDLYEQRPSASRFYGRRGYDEDESESYMVDAAKSRRYD